MVAVITLLLSKETCTPQQVAQRFGLTVKALTLAFLTELKLCQVILSKMVKTIKLTNPYAQQLDRMVVESKMEELNEETEN